MKCSEYTDLYSVYQPIVEIKTRKIIGFEALIRRKSTNGSPELLFRRAYQEGCLVDLDLRCIASALEALPKLHPSAVLFINVEPLSLVSIFHAGGPGIKLLKRFKPYCKRVVFELTEGMKGRDFLKLRQGVKSLRRYGCRFAIDDIAGIGFKLFRLLSLNPEFMKVDISLVKGVIKSEIQQELIRRILELGQRCGSQLIAEGLEKKEDVDLVFEIGIPYAQGFYYARPGNSIHLTKL